MSRPPAITTSTKPLLSGFAFRVQDLLGVQGSGVWGSRSTARDEGFRGFRTCKPPIGVHARINPLEERRSALPPRTSAEV
jgi:hypothetical protein